MGTHKAILAIAVGVLLGMVVRPILASFINPLLAPLKLAL